MIQPRKLTDCLTETLKTMENEGSSDEENAELNNKMFVKAASSAGCEYIALTYGYISTLQDYNLSYKAIDQTTDLSYKAIDQTIVLSCKTTICPTKL